MISRIPLLCIACQQTVTLRVQVGHEDIQKVATICSHCFTPIRLRLMLEHPPTVQVDFAENCEPTAQEGPVRNIGSGFVISRARLDEDQYFPVHDLPTPSPAEIADYLAASGHVDGQAAIVDLTVMLGGLPSAAARWRLLRTAFGFHQTHQEERMLAALGQFYDGNEREDGLSIESTIIRFITRFLEPLAGNVLQAMLDEAARARDVNPAEFSRLVAEFRPMGSERLSEYMDVFGQFFRVYDEFNQTLMYVRRGLELPNDPYAASVEFEGTRMYYGEAFEVLGSHLDILAALNNVVNGRPYDRLMAIGLQGYRASDKGRRADTVRTNATLSLLVREYDNKLRNASHHRWFRLSADRSEINYRDGGDGELQTLSYADYLYRCCAITAQLMLLACIEIIVLRDG